MTVDQVRALDVDDYNVLVEELQKPDSPIVKALK